MKKIKTKKFIIDLLPDVGCYATVVYNDFSFTCLPRFALTFDSRADAIDFMLKHYSDYHSAVVRTLSQFDIVF